MRGCDCFVLQSTCAPANTHLMELLIMIDALRRSSARRITAVIPYYGYARQDRKVAPARADHREAGRRPDLRPRAPTALLCIDLHAGQIQGFFNIPVDNLFATPVLLRGDPRALRAAPLTIDLARRGRRGARARLRQAPRRDARDHRQAPRGAPTSSQVMNIIGDVKGRTCVIVDDIVDTAGTLTEAARALDGRGRRGRARRDHAPGALGPGDQAHRGVAAPGARRDRHDPAAPRGAPTARSSSVVSIAQLLGEAIRRINNEESVSSLFV